MLTQQICDLILLDIHLPDGEELDLIRQIKRHMPEVPIVVITALQDEAAAAILEGDQDCIIRGLLCQAVTARFYLCRQFVGSPYSLCD